MKQLIFLVGVLMGTVASADEWRGFMSAEYRGFTSSPLDNDQHRSYVSLAVEPEYDHAWDSHRQSITIKPFYRWDQQDNARSHADVRELFWSYAKDRFELYLGVCKVFWGVTESQHLVDVINQIDLVENPDGEDKLGQPMLSTTLLTESGAIQFYLMPYFRERTFPGEEGRLRSFPRVETDEAAAYEDKKKRNHHDWAIRWSTQLGNWDVGLSHFYGTNREPRLLPAINDRGEAVLLPFYELMRQTGLDVQGAVGAWLLKLEMIARKSKIDEFVAATTGFEYTFYNVYEHGLDVGVVLEYLYDDRGDVANSYFEDDIMLGVRLTANDVQGTEFLLAMIQDRTDKARSFSLEASRRLTDYIKLVVEGRAFAGLATTDPMYSFRQDDYLQLGLNYYF